jgi:hypothetical protein
MNYKIAILRYIALFAFAFYLFWNLYFLLKVQLPPSILYKITGIPSPTTGMGRSLMAIIDFNLKGFLINNPMVILFIPILILILINLFISYCKRKKLIVKKHYTSALVIILFFGELVAINNYLF